MIGVTKSYIYISWEKSPFRTIFPNDRSATPTVGKPSLLSHDVLPTVGFDAFLMRVKNSQRNDDKAERSLAAIAVDTLTFLKNIYRLTFLFVSSRHSKTNLSLDALTPTHFYLQTFHRVFVFLHTRRKNSVDLFFNSIISIAQATHG